MKNSTFVSGIQTMRQISVFLFSVFFSLSCFSQDLVRPPGGPDQAGERQRAEEKPKPPITDYKIISIANDTVVADTSLSIYKDYKFNYLRKDNFGLLPFSNVGQTYNKLTRDFSEVDEDLTPDFGARARHFNFKEVEDIYYYHVPTPYTEAYFKTVFEQGQTLETLFTINTSNNLNLFIGYKGLRSLGKYQNILTSTGNFQMGGSYNSPNQRYRLKTHFTSQDLMNQENGGLSELALEQYLSGHEDYLDRSRLAMNFTNAESTLYGKRFFLEHSYDIVASEDSLSYNRIALGHVLDFSDKKFVFLQGAPSPTLGPSFETVDLRDEVKHENIYNEIFVNYGNDLLGEIKLKAAMTNYNYGYNAVLELDEGRISNRLIGETIAAGGEYSNNFGPFDLQGELTIGLIGEYTGNNLKAEVGYMLGEENRVALGLTRNEEAPNFNFLLYQSDYINYNWQRDFGNVVTNGFDFSFEFPTLVNLKASYTSIANYAYFGLNEENAVKPLQYDGTINYVKIEGRREFRVGKFALNNSLMYQKVLDGNPVLHVPAFVTRNTFYFEDQWFKRALFLQTGLTLNYFTNYFMDGYDPVLAEFYVQNQQEFEGFPTVDFFFNGKIRQARLFFKLEHLNSLLMGNDNFSAPLHPYRDFSVRFGLVWNFFM